MKLIFDEWRKNNKGRPLQTDVLNNKQVYLGCIQWDSEWQCFVWYQDNMVRMSSDCLMQVVSKMDELEGKKRLI